MVKIAALGINVVDIYMHEKMMFLGGNEYNIAHHVKQLGGDASYIGVFSRDNAGYQLRQHLIDIGVDVSFCILAEKGSSGYALVELNNGDRVFTDWNTDGVMDRFPIEVTRELIEYLHGYDVTSLSINSRFVYEKAVKLHDKKIPLSYDFSDQFNEDMILKYAPLLDFGFFSMSHIKSVVNIQDLLKKSYQNGCKINVATLGSKGSIAFDGKNFYFQDPIEAERIDTMGAGDSFIASFLESYISGVGDVQKVLYAATLYATQTITYKGALGFGYPVDTEHLDTYIQHFTKGERL